VTAASHKAVLSLPTKGGLACHGSNSWSLSCLSISPRQAETAIFYSIKLVGFYCIYCCDPSEQTLDDA